MGRKGGGRAGFMKAKRNVAESDDEEEQQQAQAPAPMKDEPKEKPPQKSKASQFLKEDLTSSDAPSSPAPTQPTSTAAPPPKPSADSDDDGEDNNSDSEHGETRGHMNQRHKRELKLLKDQIKRLGKKGKDQAAKLEADLAAKHAAELASLPTSNEPDGADVVAVADSLYSVSLDGGAAAAAAAGGGDGKKPSKAQKRREKLAKEEAEREARIASELAELGETERAAEERQLKELLNPMGLDIVDIPPDGHCLYRSLEHQLRHRCSSSPDSPPLPEGVEGIDFLSLRQLTAQTLRDNADRYRPFLSEEELNTSGGGGGDVDAAYEAYCTDIERTAAWGGHVEVQALAEALNSRITVYAVGMPVVEVGESEERKLKLCYLRHAYGLGEHYNSVVEKGSGDDGGESEEVESEEG